MYELISYELPVIVGRSATGADNMRKEDISKVERIKRDLANIQRSLNRTRQNIRRSINANVGRWGNERPKFVTLTFDENITEHEVANYKFMKFIQRLKYHTGVKVKYTAVIEYQHRGAIHYHVVFYNLPYVPHEKLTEIWREGHVWINAIDDVDNLGAYVLKYVLKNILEVDKAIADIRDKIKLYYKVKDDKYKKDILSAIEQDFERIKRNRGKHGKKIFQQSRGLYKPEEVDLSDEEVEKLLGELDSDDVFEKTYESEHTGKTVYRQWTKIEKSIDVRKH